MNLTKEAAKNQNNDLRERYDKWREEQSPYNFQDLLVTIVHQIQILNENMATVYEMIKTGKYDITNNI